MGNIRFKPVFEYFTSDLIQEIHLFLHILLSKWDENV